MLNQEGDEQKFAGIGNESSAGVWRFRLATALVWSVLMLVMCWLPRGVVHEVQDGSSWFKIPNFDKVVHGSIFVIFAVLWMRVSARGDRAFWVLWAGCMVAVLTEVVQELPMVGRDASFADGLADLAGLVIGLLLLPLAEPIARRLETGIGVRWAARAKKREPLAREPS